jgi:hypothetical protein
MNKIIIKELMSGKFTVGEGLICLLVSEMNSLD